MSNGPFLCRIDSKRERVNRIHDVGIELSDPFQRRSGDHPCQGPFQSDNEKMRRRRREKANRRMM